MNSQAQSRKTRDLHAAPRGQGLLELLIAIGIISASAVGTLTLVLGTTTVSSASKSQVLAMNLAREGIEVARSIRDSNWLALDGGAVPAPVNGWLTGLQSGTDYSAIPRFVPTASAWFFEFAGVAEGDLGATNTRVYLHPVDRTYIQQQTAPAAPYVATDYWRVVTLKPICWNESQVGRAQDTELLVAGDGSTCGPGSPNQAGIEIRSLVRWLDRNRTRNLTVTEKIYNWKN
ncbi:MAG: hypothetical protein HY566_01610 [Candidatus Kerfeldbacteria bacterium]|nr:hypothetical protein [Candidatus Kerfeldbacteria bacterium]